MDGHAHLSSGMRFAGVWERESQQKQACASRIASECLGGERFGSSRTFFGRALLNPPTNFDKSVTVIE